MLLFLQIDVVAKIFDPNPWNFNTKNRSLSALWIFFSELFLHFKKQNGIVSILAWNTMYVYHFSERDPKNFSPYQWPDTTPIEILK